MSVRSRLVTVTVAALLAAGGTTAVSRPASAQTGGDTEVTVGSPDTPFSQNKQNEPALAVNALHPNVLAAGANDNIDMEACNAAEDNTCPFTPGVGVSGISFSFDAGDTWVQPTYTGLTARGCLGTIGDSDPECTPVRGPIGTLPGYAESGLVSDGDPALAFGPVRGSDGTFSWTAGQRLYYANLTSKLPGSRAFTGPEAIAVSRTDDVQAAASGSNAAWLPPVVASRQNGAKFSDKEQIWADNASSSRYFGNVYVCYAAFRGNGSGNQALNVITSRDGGDTWQEHQVTPATNNPASRNGFGRSGCTVRTDSRGRVYVFDYTFAASATGAALGHIDMVTSDNGGATWSRPRSVEPAYDSCDYIEASIGRCVMDGVAGARSDLSPAPSVDIANGAPFGADATDRLVMTWVDGQTLNAETVRFSTSTNGGGTWTPPTDVQRPGDRGYYSAPAISPNGTDAWVVYNAWTTPFRTSAEGPGNDRELVGVVLHADVTSAGVGPFSEVHRGVPGDARGSSQNNLAAEFLGDYVYAVASRTFGAGVWNDVRNAADCPAMDSYRQALHDLAVSSGTTTAEAEEPRGESAGDADQAATAAPEAPDVQQVCPATFGNTDIYGGSYPDPTP
jgi:hypothetical protein